MKTKTFATPQTAKWSFVPPRDAFSPAALFDLRSLNEKVAGESGFIKVDKSGDFVLGNGKPVRFWAVNTTVGREKPWKPRPLWGAIKTEPDLPRHARFLAKRGVNMVRCHAFLQPAPTAPITDVNIGDRDWIWRTVAAMKKEGIYTTISPYFALTAKIGEAWGVPDTPADAHSLLFFDETMQKGYKAWLKALFAEKNPYTGIPLAKDPAVAIIQLQNEDSLLFWTVNNLKGAARDALQLKFGQWAVQKYGSIATTLRQWNNTTLTGDAPGRMRLDFYNIWEMTQNRTGGQAKRLDDQLQFWAETMHAFNTQMITYLRETLGCQQVINPGNWKTADTGRLNDVERWSYTAGEVLATNRYFGGIHTGQNASWAITPGDQFTRISALKSPLQLPTNLRQTAGKAMLVTESGWVMPNGYAAEGPFLTAAYQSLTGVDAFYWFSTGEEDWTPPLSANGYLKSQAKWPIATPDCLGQFPAAALLYRKGYLKRGTPVLTEHRPLTDLWKRRTALLSEEASFDPNRDAGNLAPGTTVASVLPNEAFLVGPVHVVYGGDPAGTKTTPVAPYIDVAKKTVSSNTGEIRLNWGNGVCVINAPKAQGVCGFFQNARTVTLSDITIECGNHHAAVYAVALDDKPLKISGKILLQVGTEATPMGWKTFPKTISVREGTFEGYEVEEIGGAPWQLVRAQVTLTVNNPSLRRATVLDANGMATGAVPLTKAGKGVRLKFPENALYVVLG